MNARSKVDGVGEKIRVVIGLGNPGREYDNTRHNVGFEVVDLLARQSGVSWSTEKKWEAEVARTADTLLVKPQTYMNLSGKAVSAICRFHKIEASEILVVYDDIDLELGRLRLKASGSPAGHNGVKSLIQSLGTQKFARVKFGIGRTGDSVPDGAKGGVGGDLSGYVLGKFSGTDREELEKRVARAADAVKCALSQGLTAAMNVYNEQSGSGQAKQKGGSVAKKEAREKQQSKISEKETGTSEI